MESTRIIRHTFSYSQLNTFKTCPQRYKIIYLDRIRKKHESIEAFVGKMVHGALEWLYQPDNMRKSYITFDHLCQAYDDQWAAEWHHDIYIVNNQFNSAYYYSIGKRCLSNYYHSYGSKFDQQVEDTEVEMKFFIGDHPCIHILNNM